MQVKTTDGSMVEIDMEEARRIYHEVRKRMMAQRQEQRSTDHSTHMFHINNSEVALTPGEMKMIADIWWEHYGKSRMEEFFEKYRDRAGNNIAEALGCSHAPENEKEVKGAIAMALASNNPDLAAEVIFEAMEWESAYSGLKGIEL